jgi:hypothetical protein
VKTAEEEAAKAKRDHGAASRDTKKKVAELTAEFEHQVVAAGKTTAAARGITEAQTGVNRALQADRVSKYADAMENVARQADGVAPKLAAAARAAAALARQLGRLPSRKEINVYVNIHSSGVAGINVPGVSRGGGGPSKWKFATGGYVSRCRPVPVLAVAPA